MPVSCKLIDGKHRLVEPDGSIAKTSDDVARDGGGHDSPEKCKAQMRAINSKLAEETAAAAYRMMFRTTTDEFHWHSFIPESDFTASPIGDEDGHRHKILRDDEGLVTGFEESAGHSHGIIELEELFAEDAQDYASLRGVEIFKVGVWNGDTYNRKDLDEMVTNFKKVGFVPPVKLGHVDDADAPAVGWIDKLYRRGDKLIADIKDIPQKVFETIEEHMFDTVSAEIFWNLKRNGQTFRRALKALALLGANVPAVSDLKPLRDSFSEVGDDCHAYSSDQFAEEADMDKLKELEAKVTELTEALAKITASRADDEAGVKTLTEERDALKLRLKELEGSGDAADALVVKNLEARVQKAENDLQASRTREREARIDQYVSKLKIPALRDHFRSLYGLALPEDGTETVVNFTHVTDDNKTVSSDMPAEKLIDTLVDKINGFSEFLFKEHSENAGVDRDLRHEAAGEESPGQELDRQAKEYVAEHNVDYTKAFQAVVKMPKNAELKEAYARSSN